MLFAAAAERAAAGLLAVAGPVAFDTDAVGGADGVFVVRTFARVAANLRLFTGRIGRHAGGYAIAAMVE